MSMQTPPDPDDTLDREARDLAALYRQLPQAEPDAALDARILAQADGAVARRPRRHARLLVGLGSVCAVAMAAGLTWHMMATRSTLPPQTLPPPGANAARAGASDSRVMRFRIITDAQDNQAQAGASRERATLAAKRADRASARQASSATPPPPPTPAAPPPLESRVVVPVRILPSPPPPGSATAAEAPAGDAAPPMSSQALVNAARRALAGNDPDQARRYVKQLVQAYPHEPLPDDLAALAPSPPTSTKP